MIVDCAHYADGLRQREEQLDLDAAAEVYRREDEPGFVWIALLDPDPAELAKVQDLFGLHDLAVEDAQAFHLRPKVEQYDDGQVLFAVIRTAQYVDDQEDVEFGEVSIFLARRFLITVRHGVASELASARRRLEARPELLKAGPAAGLWAILDKIVDDYAPVIAGLENDVEQVEATVFRGTAAATERIYKLRREATDFYRAVHPLLGPLDALERAAYPHVGKQLRPFFRDVNDHLKLVNEEVVGLRDILATVLAGQYRRDIAGAKRYQRPSERDHQATDRHRHHLPAPVLPDRLLRYELRLARRPRHVAMDVPGVRPRESGRLVRHALRLVPSQRDGETHLTSLLVTKRPHGAAQLGSVPSGSLTTDCLNRPYRQHEA